MRDYKKEYREYHARPEQKKNRAARNLWNRRLKGRVPAGKEIDHRRPLSAGGGNTRGNIRYRTVGANRGDKSHMKEASIMFYDHLEKLAAIRDAARQYEDRRNDRRERKADLGHALIALGGGGTGYGVSRHLQGSIDALEGKSFLGGLAGLPKSRDDLMLRGGDVGKYLSSRADRAKHLARLSGVGAGVGATMLASRGYNSLRDEYDRRYGRK